MFPGLELAAGLGLRGCRVVLEALLLPSARNPVIW